MIRIIKKVNIEKLIFINIMVFMIGIPAIILYRYTCLRLGFYNICQINRAYLLWFGLPFLLVLYVLDLIFNKKKITYIDLLIYLLIILGIISTIYAVDTSVSIHGEYTRNEGLLSLLTYYFILLNLKNMSNEKYKSILIKTFIVIGVVQVIYSILQVYTELPFIMHFQLPYMACGLVGNPNFLGSYMIILVSFSFSTYMLKRKRKYLVLSIIFFVGICLSSSTGPFISLVLLIIFFAIFYRRRIIKKDLLKILLLFSLIYFFVDFSVKYIHINIFKNIIDPRYNISLELANLDFSGLGNGRIELWKDSLPLVKKYWVVGAGLDNFGKVYGIKNDLYFDKAHNVYLQIAITNGIFALITYMVLIMFIFFKGLKIKEELYISMLMAFIGYSIQAFANISVIEVAPAFFGICGLLSGKIQKNNKVQYKTIQ